MSDSEKINPMNKKGVVELAVFDTFRERGMQLVSKTDKNQMLWDSKLCSLCNQIELVLGKFDIAKRGKLYAAMLVECRESIVVCLLYCRPMEDVPRSGSTVYFAIFLSNYFPKRDIFSILSKMEEKYNSCERDQHSKLKHFELSDIALDEHFVFEDYSSLTLESHNQEVFIELSDRDEDRCYNGREVFFEKAFICLTNNRLKAVYSTFGSVTQRDPNIIKIEAYDLLRLLKKKRVSFMDILRSAARQKFSSTVNVGTSDIPHDKNHNTEPDENHSGGGNIPTHSRSQLGTIVRHVILTIVSVACVAICIVFLSSTITPHLRAALKIWENNQEIQSIKSINDIMHIDLDDKLDQLINEIPKQTTQLTQNSTKGRDFYFSNEASTYRKMSVYYDHLAELVRCGYINSKLVNAVAAPCDFFGKTEPLRKFIQDNWGGKGISINNKQEFQPHYQDSKNTFCPPPSKSASPKSAPPQPKSEEAQDPRANTGG